MRLTSRKKRPLDRSIPHLRDTRLVIIAAEGAKTEKLYFESLLFQNHRVQLFIIESEYNLSAPNHVLDRLRSFAKEKDLQKDDCLWLVLDTDRWPPKLLSEVCSHAIRGQHKADLAISNPCFELWLYLHFGEWTGGAVTSKEMRAEMKKLPGGYRKESLDPERYKAGIEVAVQRARMLDASPKNRWPDNPGTHVYKVVESIWALERR